MVSDKTIHKTPLEIFFFLHFIFTIYQNYTLALTEGATHISSHFPHLFILVLSEMSKTLAGIVQKKGSTLSYESICQPTVWVISYKEITETEQKSYVVSW